MVGEHCKKPLIGHDLSAARQNSVVRSMQAVEALHVFFTRVQSDMKKRSARGSCSICFNHVPHPPVASGRVCHLASLDFFGKVLFYSRAVFPASKRTDSAGYGTICFRVQRSDKSNVLFFNPFVFGRQFNTVY